VGSIPFHDLPASCFPFTVILADAGTGDECWRTVVTGPGALHVPSKGDINAGRPVSVRIEWADGDVSETTRGEK